MFQFCTILLAVAIVVYEYMVWKFDYWIKRNLPGPKPKPLLGNLPNLILSKMNIFYDYEEIYKKYKGKSPLVGIFAIRKPQILVTDGEMVINMVIKHFKHFSTNNLTDIVDPKADPLLSRNPFFLDGYEWKEKRTEIIPAFTVNRLKAAYPLLEDVCKQMTVYLDKNTGLDLELKELSSKFTTDVIANMIFAMDAESFKSEKSIIREMGHRIFGDQSFWFKSYFILITIFPAFKKFYKRSIVPKDVEGFFSGLMRDAAEYRLKSNFKRVDYMDYLLQLQKNKSLSSLEMAAHSLTFFLDGIETSSVLIAYVMFELSQNPEIQSKLRDEIREIRAKRGELSYEAIAEMEYLEQICNEALRLHTPIAVLTKKCSEDINLAYGNKTVAIERGTSIVIPLLALHRDPLHYTDPDTFNPDRFSAENGGAKVYRDKSVFLPFGIGPRICLGLRLAMAQSKSAIVEVVENFEILRSSKVQLPLTISPEQFLNLPIGGLWAKFKPITK